MKNFDVVMFCKRYRLLCTLSKNFLIRYFSSLNKTKIRKLYSSKAVLYEMQRKMTKSNVLVTTHFVKNAYVSVTFSIHLLLNEI